MRTSEKTDKLSNALAVAQGVIAFAKKDSANPFFKSSYADLASVIEAVRKPLADNKLAVMQGCVVDGGVTLLTTRLSCEDQWVESDTPVLCSKPNDPQALGSAITYARRYSLSAMLGVAADDDDAETAMARDGKPSAPPAPAKAKAPSMSLPPPIAAPATKNRDYPLPPPASKGGIPDDADCAF
jgi:hypothetical protein